MEKVSLSCSCLLLGDFKTLSRSTFISEKGWYLEVSSVDSKSRVELEISQVDILKTFAFLEKDKSYIFVNVNEKKCVNIQNAVGMTNSEYKLDINSSAECQRRVVIVLENVVDVCHNILRQRFKFFHELKDRAAAENLFKYACKKRNPLKRSIGSSNEAVIVAKKRPKHIHIRSDSEHQDTQEYTSDLSFEISKKQITDQVLNMELDLKKKKQDILNLRMDYFEEKELVDNQIKSLEKRVNCKEKQIDVAFPKLNGEIHELERRIIELKQEKREHLEELQTYNDNLEKNTKKKLGLKAKFLNHMKLEQSRVSEIKSNLTKLKGAEVILNTKDTNIDNIEKFDRLSSQIEKYERKLECPVCLETCQQPIYQCLESHIICNKCRVKVKRCPQCLVSFEKLKQRHRYAEEDSEELLKLYKEREAVFNNIHIRGN